MTKICKQCGLEFEPKKVIQVMCTASCVAKYRNKLLALYTHEHKQYMVDHYGKVPHGELAEYLQLDNPETLRKLASRFRKEGYPVPVLDRGSAKTPLGTITFKKHGKYTYKFTMTENGWRHVSSEEKRPYVRTIRKKPEIVVKAKKQIVGRPLKPAKPAKATFQTKVEDLSIKVPVFIPSLRAVVFARPGAYKEQVKQKYIQQHAKQLGAVKI